MSLSSPKLLILSVALFGVLAFVCASCAQIESRPATMQLTEHDLRDAHGRYRAPTHRVTREPAVTQQTLYRTASGAEMHGPLYKLRPPR